MTAPTLTHQNLAAPQEPDGTGALVLSRSSGRVEVGRADPLAAEGVHALTYLSVQRRGRQTSATTGSATSVSVTFTGLTMRANFDGSPAGVVTS